MPTHKRDRKEAILECSPGTDATHHLCFILGKVVRRVVNLYHQPLAAYGMTPSQLFVFSSLWMEDGINFSDLASKVAIDVSTLTGIIDRMEKRGLVERKPDQKDRRAVRLYLTEKAKETGPVVLKLARDLDSVLRSPFSQEELAVFEHVMKRLGEGEG